MNLEEKTAGAVGAAFLAGFLLCYYLMGNAPPPVGQKPFLTSALRGQKIVVSHASNQIQLFSEDTDLRTDITHEVMRHKVDVRPARGVNTPAKKNPDQPVIESQPFPDLWPDLKYKPNRDLIDFQYQPKIDPKELLAP